jgi:hypothetical protein
VLINPIIRTRNRLTCGVYHPTRHNIVTCRGDYGRGFGLDDWIYSHFIHRTRHYRQYSAIADLHTLRFTVTHALGFSVFTGRILATDFIRVSLSFHITHEVFFAQPSFLAIILQMPVQKTRINSISSAPKLISRQAAVSKLDSGQFYAAIISFGTLLYNCFARTTQKTQRIYCWEGVFTAPLYNNGSYLIVACVFVAAGMCLPSRCLAMNVYSDFIIPAFKRRVTMYILVYIYTHIYLSINPFTRTHVAVHLFTNPLTHSPLHQSVHPSTLHYVCPFTHPLIPPAHSHIRPFIHIHTYPPVPHFVHPPTPTSNCVHNTRI